MNLKIYILLIGVGWIGFSPSVTATSSWQILEPGLVYRESEVSSASARVHLLKINLNHYKLGLLHASEHGNTRALLEQLVAKSEAVAAINASFFDIDGRAMGLVIQDFKKKNSLRQTSWGVFQIIRGVPSIIHTREYRTHPKRELAVQTGPRLIIKGRIPHFKQDIPSRRSAICITRSKEIVLAVAHAVPLSLKDFAGALKPFCTDALNFDGGSSTQFYLNTEKRKKILPGHEPIPNALAVFRRK